MSAPEPKQTRAAVAAGQPAAEAMQAILDTCARDFERHRRRLMRRPDPEGPHGARVALRRLRTALGAFRPILRRSRAGPLQEEARALFRLLGPLRDADVLALGMAGTDSHAALAARADAARAEARAALQTVDAEGLAGRVAGLTAGKGWRRRRAKALAGGPIEVLAAQALAKAWAQVGSHGDSLAEMATDERHEFRKDLKALRYLTDFFGPLWPGKEQARFLKRLKRLQGALGTLNDLAVAESTLGPDEAGARAEAAAAAMAEAEHDWHKLRERRPWWEAG